jgi:hypothetical protein
MDYIKELNNARTEMKLILELYKKKRKSNKILTEETINILDNYIYKNIITNKMSDLNYQIKFNPIPNYGVIDDINKILNFSFTEKPFYYILNGGGKYYPLRGKVKDSLIDNEIPTKYILLDDLEIDLESKYFNYEYYYPFVIFNIKKDYYYKPFFDEFKKEKLVLVDDINELKKDKDEYCNKLYSYYQNTKYKNYMKYKENNFFLKLIKGRDCVLTINKYNKG